MAGAGRREGVLQRARFAGGDLFRDDFLAFVLNWWVDRATRLNNQFMGELAVVGDG